MFSPFPEPPVPPKVIDLDRVARVVELSVSRARSTKSREHVAEPRTGASIVRIAEEAASQLRRAMVASIECDNVTPIKQITQSSSRAQGSQRGRAEEIGSNDEHEEDDEQGQEGAGNAESQVWRDELQPSTAISTYSISDKPNAAESRMARHKALEYAVASHGAPQPHPPNRVSVFSAGRRRHGEGSTSPRNHPPSPSTGFGSKQLGAEMPPLDENVVRAVWRQQRQQLFGADSATPAKGRENRRSCEQQAPWGDQKGDDTDEVLEQWIRNARDGVTDFGAAVPKLVQEHSPNPARSRRVNEMSGLIQLVKSNQVGDR